MTVHSIPVVVPGLAAVAVAAASAGAAVYQEVYPNDTGSSVTLESVGWAAHFQEGTEFDLADDANGPRVTEFSGPDGNAGVLFHGNYQRFTDWIWWTEELVSFGEIDEIDSISFFLRNSQVDENTRVALRIGSSWYVSETVFNRDPADSSVWEFNEWDLTGGVRNLNFVPGTSLVLGSLTALPATGTVTAVGFFDEFLSSTIRADNYTINLIPEPTSMALLGLGGLGLLRRRR